MKVKRNTLLLLACLVWSAAGFNILRIGLMSYSAYRTVLNCLLSILVFGVFQKFIFGKLVKKHTARIHSYEEERHFFLKFFDGKAFAVMAVMMTGASVCGRADWRRSGLSPFFIPVWAPRSCWRDYCLAVTLAGRYWPLQPFQMEQHIKEDN